MLVLWSCGDKKLDRKKWVAGDLEIDRYQVSRITSLYEQVDVTKDGETVQILTARPGDIDSIFLSHDTLVIQTVRHPDITKDKDRVFNYTIEIDSIPPVINDTIYGYQHPDRSNPLQEQSKFQDRAL